VCALCVCVCACVCVCVCECTAHEGVCVCVDKRLPLALSSYQYCRASWPWSAHTLSVSDFSLIPQLVVWWSGGGLV